MKKKLFKVKKTQTVGAVQKAANGFQDVTVPPTGDTMNVLSSGLSMGATGASIGGPWGALAGAVVGTGLGLIQKRKQDAANAGAIEANKLLAANRTVSGTDITVGQGHQQYEDGTEATMNTKPIEVEKDELVFRKVGNQFKLKADFKGGAKHSEGGEPYLAQDGDVIFPGKMRKGVLQAYESGNHRKIEGMRLKLPKDTNNGKAGKGWQKANHGSVVSPTSYGRYPLAIEAATNNPSKYSMANGKSINPEWDYPLVGHDDVNGSGEITWYKDSREMPLIEGGVNTSMPTSIPSIVTPVEQTAFPATQNGVGNPIEVEKEGLSGGGIARYANIANNLVQSFKKPFKVKENYVNPEQIKYRDQSEPLRQESRSAARMQTSNARNLAGGNVGNVRANAAAADAANVTRIEGIDGREMARKDGIDVTNLQARNQARFINSGKADQYQAQNNDALGQQQAFMGAATSEVAQLAETNMQMDYMKKRDNKLDANELRKFEIMNGGNRAYSFNDPNSPNIKFTPNGTNMYADGIGTAPATSTTTTTDAKGNESTRQTVKYNPLSGKFGPSRKFANSRNR